MRVGETRWERDKRRELDANSRDLVRARAALDALVRRTHARGLDPERLEDLAPVSLEIARLRLRAERLADELAAISGEWAA